MKWEIWGFEYNTVAFFGYIFVVKKKSVGFPTPVFFCLLFYEFNFPTALFKARSEITWTKIVIHSVIAFIGVA